MGGTFLTRLLVLQRVSKHARRIRGGMGVSPMSIPLRLTRLSAEHGSEACPAIRTAQARTRPASTVRDGIIAMAALTASNDLPIVDFAGLRIHVRECQRPPPPPSSGLP